MARIGLYPARRTRRPHKLLMLVLGLLGLVIALAAVGPLFVDWNRFKPRIVQVVRDATGLELRIDGDIRVALLPGVEVSADGVRLLTTAGFESPRLASIETVHGRMRLWPLLLGRVDVERIRVDHLELALEVNSSGEPNWKARVVAPRRASETTAEGPSATSRAGEGAAGDWGLPWLRDIRLGELRLTDSLLSFHDARSGWRAIATEWEMVTSPAVLSDPFDVDATMRLNDEPVAITASVEPLRAALEHRHLARLRLSMHSRHIEVRLDTTRRPPSLIRLEHVGSIDVPSLGALAQWLDMPFDTDPGPIALRARIESNGTKAVRAELSAEGEGLDARSTVDLDLDGDMVALVAKLEGGFLDLDRYAPPALLAKWTQTERPSLMEWFGTVAETPLDLDTLRRLTAEIDIDIAGFGLAGYAVAPFRLQASANDGQVEAALGDVGFYDGAFSGALRLGAGTETLGVEASVGADNINASAVGAVLAPDAPAVTGTASGRLELQTQGRTLRELTANAVGLLRADLVSDDDVGRVGQLSRLSLTLQRPAGADARLSLLADAVYGAEAVVVVITTDPPRAVLAGAPVAVEAEIESEVVEASYQGRVLQFPVLSLDGEFDAKVRSVARLARWLGRPLAKHQADPGRLEAHALFRSDGRSGTVEEATLRAEGLSIRASGDFESMGDRVRFNLAAEGGLLDLDRFLPAQTTAAAASEAGDTPLMAFSDDPFDASWLRDYIGGVDLKLAGLKVSDVQTGAIAVAGVLDDGVLEARLDKLVLPELTVSAVLRADGSTEEFRAEANARLDDIKMTRLDSLLGPTGRAIGDASGTLTVSTRGNSPRRLVAGADGELSLRVGRAELYKGPFAVLSNIEATTELRGLDTEAQIMVSADLEARGSGERYPFELQAQLGPPSEAIGARELRLALLSTVGENKVSVNGRVTDLGATPSAALDIRLTGPRLSGLGADTDGRLMDVGPVSIEAMLETQPGVYRISGLKAEVAGSDLSGDIVLVFDAGRPRISADVRSDAIDLWELLPYRPVEATAEPVTSHAPSYLFEDRPLPFAELKSVDADVHVSVAKLRTEIGTRIDDVEARVVLSEGRLEAAPVTGGFASGRTDLRLLLDANEQPARFHLELKERQMLFGTLVPIIVSSGESVGRVDVDLDVTGVGNTPRAIASSLDGHLALAGEGGAVDPRVLRLLVIGIGDILRPFFNRQGNTHLNCVVAGVEFEQGLGTMRTFLVDMPALAIGGSGNIDLRDETLALRFRTDSRHASLASFTGPFYVTGALGSPRARTSTAGTAFAAVTSPLTITHGVLGRLLRRGRNLCEMARVEVQPVLDDPFGSPAKAPRDDPTQVIQSDAPRRRPSRRY